MFKLIVCAKSDSDSENTWSKNISFSKNQDGDLVIDLDNRVVVLKESDIEKLIKLLEL